MVRASLTMVVLLGLCACGQTERAPAGPIGGAGVDAGAGTATVAGAGTGGSPGGTSGAGASAGGLAGAAGSAPLQSPVAECERYCETLHYRLPQALCEDWNRPGWAPTFCNLAPTASCADYCANVYETVSPACAATLPEVIRCVAPTYASFSLPPPGQCWLGECRPLLFTMTAACYGLADGLLAARATWEASGVTDYQLEFDLSDGMRAQVAVRTGSEPMVTPVDAIAWTVPMLFDEVERTLRVPGVAPVVTYDAALGYVTGLVRQEGCTEGSVIASGVKVAPLR